MFPYDDHDYESLLNDPAVDPDSADALYALAQFCRSGKGCPASEVAYQKYLQRAADAGSVQAKTELDAVTAAKKPMLDKVDISAMSLGELVTAADDGKADALVPAARRALKLGDTQRAVRYLKRALDFMSTGAYVYTDEEAQDICMTLAHIMQGDPYNDEKAATHYYGMAQEFGSVQAARLLERRYRTGTGVAQDDAQADVYALIAARSGSTTDLINYALGLEKRGKKVDVVVLLEEAKAAKDKDAASVAFLLLVQMKQQTPTVELMHWAWEHMTKDGKAYKFSVKVSGTPFSDEALNLCRDAALETYNCTPEYAKNHKLPIDFLIATQKMRGAATHEEKLAWALLAEKFIDETKNDSPEYAGVLCAIAECYQNGTNGVAQNLDKAIQYYGKAGALKKIDTIRRLGASYKQNKQYREAFTWFEKGAQKGDAHCQKELGFCYVQGYGVEKNSSVGYQWMEKAANKDGEAQIWVAAYQVKQGLSCMKAMDGPKHYAMAYAWFEKAANNGNAEGRLWVGRCYENGWGVPVDPAKALAMYKKAAKKNNVEAYTEAARFYFQGVATRVDYAAAAEYCEKILKSKKGSKAFAYDMLGKIAMASGKATKRSALECFQNVYKMGDHCEAAFNVALAYDAEDEQRYAPENAVKADAYLAKARANGYPTEKIEATQKQFASNRERRAEERVERERKAAEERVERERREVEERIAREFKAAEEQAEQERLAAEKRTEQVKMDAIYAVREKVEKKAALEEYKTIMTMAKIFAMLLLVPPIGIPGLIIVALLGFHQEAELKKKGWYEDAKEFISKK